MARAGHQEGNLPQESLAALGQRVCGVSLEVFKTRGNKAIAGLPGGAFSITSGRSMDCVSSRGPVSLYWGFLTPVSRTSVGFVIPTSEL